MVVGYGGTAPSSALALLDVALAMSSERRLESGAVALVTRLAPLSDQAPRGWTKLMGRGSPPGGLHSPWIGLHGLTQDSALAR